MIGFTFVPADNPAVDDEYVVTGTDRELVIQVCSLTGMYVVVEHDYTDINDEDSFWAQDLMRTNSLEKAKTAVIKMLSEGKNNG